MGGSQTLRTGGELRRPRWIAWSRILAGIGVVVVGVVVFAVVQAHVDWLTAHGRRTPAVVVGTDPACGSEDVPRVAVRFTVFSGVEVTDDLATDGTECSSFHVGQKVWVMVDPSDSSNAALAGGYADVGTSGWIAFGLVLLGIGISWRGWRQLLAVQRAHVQSVGAPGADRSTGTAAEPPRPTPDAPVPARGLSTPPAWHTDPWGLAPLRWWDGERWTESTSPWPSGPSRAATPDRPTVPSASAPHGASGPGVVAPVGPAPKSQVTAGVLAITLGWLGVHRFYLGFTGIGLLMLLLSVVTVVLAPVVAVWGIVEGVLILRGSRSYSHDARGARLRPRQPSRPPGDDRGT